MKALIILATLFLAQISYAQVENNTSIGKFEKRQRIVRLVDEVVVTSGLSRDMKDQPNDLIALKAALVKGALKDKQNHETLITMREGIKEIKKLPKEERESLLFRMKITISMFAFEFGYREQDN